MPRPPAENKTAPNPWSWTCLAGLFVCGLLLFTQLFNSAFDLPPEARNLSPFDPAIFATGEIEAVDLGSLHRDPDLRRLGIWIALILGVHALAHWIRPLRRIGEKVWKGFLRIPHKPYVLSLVAAQFLLAAGLSHFAFERMPHVQDAIGQLFQARIFADGQLWAQPFRLSGPFSFYTVIEGDRWFSQHPPGLPLLLVPFIHAGAAWLLNPLLGAGCSFLTYRLARMLFGDPTSRLALLLCLASPFHAFMSASFLSW